MLPLFALLEYPVFRAGQRVHGSPIYDEKYGTWREAVADGDTKQPHHQVHGHDEDQHGSFSQDRYIY